jgi:hypothetical protein
MSIGEQFDKELQRELERCDQEIAEIAARSPETEKAYLTVLGTNDWEHEKRILRRTAAIARGAAR